MNLTQYNLDILDNETGDRIELDIYANSLEHAKEQAREQLKNDGRSNIDFVEHHLQYYYR